MSESYAIAYTGDFDKDIEHKFSNLHKLYIRILRKNDIILYLLKMFRKTKYKLPDEIWYVILNEYIDEGISPSVAPKHYHYEAKHDYAYGKSLCGLPYGVWAIYTKCPYYYAPAHGECPHYMDECMRLSMHIPITDKNLNFWVNPLLNPSMVNRYRNITPNIITNPFILYQSNTRHKMGKINIKTNEKNPLHVRNGLIYNIIHHHSDYKQLKIN